MRPPMFSSAGRMAPRPRGRRRRGESAALRLVTSSRPSSRIMTFDEALAFALTLPDTEAGTSYGKPAVKVASNGRAFLFPSHESATSFAIAMDLDTIEILKATDPE